MNKIKIINMMGNNVTINLSRFNNKEIPLSPHGFCFLTEDELAYVRNTSKAFEKGTIKVQDLANVPETIDIPESQNAMSDSDIKILLKKAQKAIAYKLTQIDSEHTVKRMLEIAKDIDKSIKVINMIEKRLEELRQ